MGCKPFSDGSVLTFVVSGLEVEVDCAGASGSDSSVSEVITRFFRELELALTEDDALEVDAVGSTASCVGLTSTLVFLDSLDSLGSMASLTDGSG